MARPVGRRGETRERVIDTALALFAEHGVKGTSLQMIADRLGVTKAAVYYQFPAKEDIVLAVVRPAFEQIGTWADAAEAETDPARRADAMLVGLVEVVLGHRQAMASLQGDAGVAEILRTHPELVGQLDRIGLLLHGPDPDLATRVSVAMLGGLSSVGADPSLADVDADDLRRALLTAARRLLEVG